MITFVKRPVETTAFTPMDVIHHQRTIPAFFKTDEVKQDMLNDEYNNCRR